MSQSLFRSDQRIDFRVGVKRGIETPLKPLGDFLAQRRQSGIKSVMMIGAVFQSRFHRFDDEEGLAGLHLGADLDEVG